MASVLLVSISCITYNHNPYIRQCLDGFFLQQCNFDFEILIYDDASTDGTSDIIRTYQKKYPDIVKPIIQKENQYSQGIRGIMARFNYPRAKGKYIAMCEGDDYWTDPLKLQKQVDFLEKHTEYSMVFTGRQVVDKNGRLLRNEIPEKRIFYIQDIFSGYIPTTQTILFKNDSFVHRFLAKNNHIPSGDRMIAYINAQAGDIYCLPDITAAYRETGKGVWSSFSETEKLKKKQAFLSEFHKTLGWDIENPKYIFFAFDNLLGMLIKACLNPRLLFDTHYRKTLTMIWGKYRYMNRSKLLRQAFFRKLRNVFNKVKP